MPELPNVILSEVSKQEFVVECAMSLIYYEIILGSLILCLFLLRIVLKLKSYYDQSVSTL